MSAQLHYPEHGKGDPLVLLHANPGDSRDFDAVIPALAASRDGRVAAAAISGTKSVTLPCGHASFAEIPEAFPAEVEPFLASAAPADTHG